MSKPGTWIYSGLCGQTDPDIFSSPDPADILAAKQICGRCPVLRDCHAYAAANEVNGVCGGLSERERTALATCRIAS